MEESYDWFILWWQGTHRPGLQASWALVVSPVFILLSYSNGLMQTSHLRPLLRIWLQKYCQVKTIYAKTNPQIRPTLLKSHMNTLALKSSLEKGCKKNMPGTACSSNQNLIFSPMPIIWGWFKTEPSLWGQSEVISFPYREGHVEETPSAGSVRVLNSKSWWYFSAYKNDVPFWKALKKKILSPVLNQWCWYAPGELCPS